MESDRWVRTASQQRMAEMPIPRDWGQFTPWGLEQNYPQQHVDRLSPLSILRQFVQN